MNNIRFRQACRNLLLMLWVALLLSACGVGHGIYKNQLPVASTPAERKAYLASEIDHILATQQDASKPGVSVIVAKDGEIVYSHSKGMADINQGMSITANTVFNIASVSKPITAIAIMQLMERRLLSLGDSVLKWLPSLPSTWHGITIHHLLSHQSGIPDCCSGIILEKFQELDGLNNQQVLQRIAQDDTLLFVPGSSGRYSNSNYIILAEIIGQASGVSYAEYLRFNIFAPLGMSSYVYGHTPQTGVAVALNNGLSSKIHGITYAVTGSDGSFASTSDLGAFSSGLLSGKLVSVNTLQLMTMDQSKAMVDVKRGGYYGYGWYVPELGRGLDVFAHYGGTDGFSSLLRINYKTSAVVILLGNGGKTTGKIMNAIAGIADKVYP